MGERGLLIDSDIFLMLSGADLLENTLSLLRFGHKEVYRLNALPYMIDGRKLRENYPEDFRKKAKTACERISPFLELPDPGLEEQLYAVPGIEEDAFLYATLTERPYLLLASADKRAMEAVGMTPSLESIRKAIRGRVICLEHVLRLLVEEDGVKATARKFRPMISDHATLKIVFSPHNLSHPDQALQALDSFLNDLRRKTGGILFEE